MIAHCGSLTQLDIALSTNISSAMIHMILCSCSTLVAMKADNILASDLVKFDKPWACTNLQKWEIAIEMDINGVGTHRQVFARLSTLTKVLTLNLSSDKDLRLSRGTNHPFLALRLSHGMDRLASMEHLRVLQIDYTNQRMAKVDWEWVVATFQRLRSIQGRSVGAYDDYKDYSAAMSYAGVEYSFWAEPRSRLRQPKSA
ncbi:hypothetical protein BGZ83_000120 [Gryganskiella cystojenkinii]|nr:hypothetical protein BGZ83_000120 [Gryganskiella cystojenkinii]